MPGLGSYDLAWDDGGWKRSKLESDHHTAPHAVLPVVAGYSKQAEHKEFPIAMPEIEII